MQTYSYANADDKSQIWFVAGDRWVDAATHEVDEFYEAELTWWKQRLPANGEWVANPLRAGPHPTEKMLLADIEFDDGFTKLWQTQIITDSDIHALVAEVAARHGLDWNWVWEDDSVVRWIDGEHKAFRADRWYVGDASDISQS